MKAKAVKGNWSLRANKLSFPYVFLICIFFFLAGFFGFTLFFNSQGDGHGLRPRQRLLESMKEVEYNLMSVGELGDDSITSIPFQVLSWKPRALYFPNFATAEQCESIVEVAKDGLKPSTLALRKGETEENTKGIRTSSGVFVSASEDKTGTLDVIEEKIARATMIPRTHGEAFNILRYEVGQRYNSHYDAFNPDEYGPQKTQRMASFLLYLTDVEEGGETMFPFENGLNMDGNYGYEDCLGLRVKPRQGDGLLFYSLLPNGTIDPTSLHGSCPVIKGEKWVATKWIRDQEQDD
ncbi:putative prolyl 4-hydroxylase 9 [Mucuna pruriens]|uniref:procollagen-proline 4-dioxygenase n=1 Tax=Mucuna pruriens TaxID=157652 RepID=A0A371EBS3_MUCPR|nr:putative prolyl 4-hydroxylase 9 [Mucuna pruriens]